MVVWLRRQQALFATVSDERARQSAARNRRQPTISSDVRAALGLTHWASDIIEKPALAGIQALAGAGAALHALWPLQALAAMHLPCAASAGVDTVEDGGAGKEQRRRRLRAWHPIWNSTS
jgi:hypothetical protein